MTDVVDTAAEKAKRILRVMGSSRRCPTLDARSVETPRLSSPYLQTWHI
jgi:hypothetical protein